MDPQQQQAQQLIHQFMGLYFGVIALAFIVKVVLYVIPMWRIATKAGKPGAIALLCAIPLVGRLITAYVLAFSDWTPPAAPYYGGNLPPGGYSPTTYAPQQTYPGTTSYPAEPPSTPPTQL